MSVPCLLSNLPWGMNLGLRRAATLHQYMIYDSASL